MQRDHRSSPSGTASGSPRCVCPADGRTGSRYLRRNHRRGGSLSVGYSSPGEPNFSGIYFFQNFLSYLCAVSAPAALDNLRV